MTPLEMDEVHRIVAVWRSGRPRSWGVWLKGGLRRYLVSAPPDTDGDLVLQVCAGAPLRLTFYRGMRHQPIEARYEAGRWRMDSPADAKSFRAKCREAGIGWVADQIEAADAGLAELAKEIPS